MENDNTEIRRAEGAGEISEAETLPIEALRKLGIDFVRLTHPAADTMELCEGIGAEYGARHCKNLFLTNRSGNNFHLLLMDADKPYRTSEVSRRLGVSRLSFGTAEQLKRVLGLEPGSVTVMGLVNGCAREAYESGALHIAIDRDLLARERICVHPNVNTATLVISCASLIKFIEGMGMSYTAVDV